MAWFDYRQNNSGGSFTGEYLYIFVEANSPEQADEVAEEHGVYFDDDYTRDCNCCGTRWSRAYGTGSEAPDEPTVWGARLYDGLSALYVHGDGTTEVKSLVKNK
jgi:hypothetical protein